MLRIEAYPALGGLIVRVCTTGHCAEPPTEGIHPTSVTRLVPQETIECLGIQEALRDVIVDVVTLYPGILEFAMH